MAQIKIELADGISMAFKMAKNTEPDGKGFFIRSRSLELFHMALIIADSDTAMRPVRIGREEWDEVVGVDYRAFKQAARVTMTKEQRKLYDIKQKIVVGKETNV